MKTDDLTDDPKILRNIESNPRAYFVKRGLVLALLTLGLIALTTTYFAAVNTPGTAKFTGDNEILLFTIILIFEVYYYRQTRKGYRAYKQMKHGT
ncbi:MAG TPA: hypothetical protein VL633_13390 [Bacteroidota bacterium]|jgi:hypothetical protein|nr:hypothetical protein [Bacteroidota bacterium]